MKLTHTPTDDEMRELYRASVTLQIEDHLGDRPDVIDAAMEEFELWLLSVQERSWDMGFSRGSHVFFRTPENPFTKREQS